MTEATQTPKVKPLNEVAGQYKTRIPVANQAAVNAPFKQEQKVEQKKEAPIQKKTNPTSAPLASRIPPPPPTRNVSQARKNVQPSAAKVKATTQTAQEPEVKVENEVKKEVEIQQKKPTTAPTPPPPPPVARKAVQQQSQGNNAQKAKNEPKEEKVQAESEDTTTPSLDSPTVASVTPPPPPTTSRANLKQEGQSKKGFSNSLPNLPSNLKEQTKAIQKRNAIRQMRQDAFIDLSASRSLASIICALSIKPGLGAEVKTDVRRENIALLMEKAHELTSYLHERLRPEQPINQALYGSLLQESARHIAYLWDNDEDLDAIDAKVIADEMLNHSNLLLGNEFLASFSTGNVFELDDEYKQKYFLTSTVVRELNKTRNDILSVKIGDYIEEGAPEDISAYKEKYKNENFFFNDKNSFSIAADLVNVAVNISKQYALNTDDAELNSTWNSGLVARSSDMVRAEYKMLVTRILRSSLSNLNLHEQELNKHRQNYGSVLNAVEKRAQANLDLTLKTARQLTDNKVFLQHKKQEQQLEQEQRSGTPKESV